MRSGIRNLNYRIAARLDLPRMIHYTLLRKQLTIVMYHAVVRSPLQIYDTCFTTEASFRTQVKYLQTHFDVLLLSEALARMKAGRIRRPTAVITLDDGYQNNYDIVFPILLQAGLPATIFVTTGLVNTDDTLWACRLHHALIRTSQPELEWAGRKFDLSGPRHKVAAAIRARLKGFAQPQLLAELRKIILQLGVDPDHPIEVGSPFRMLSRDAIREMLASGLIEFGAHTHSHAILSCLSSEERDREIKRSLEAIRELTGRACELFAYPNGRRKDYDLETIRTLEACGVRAAVTAMAGFNNKATPIMELNRYGISADLSIADFQLTVHHWRNA